MSLMAAEAREAPEAVARFLERNSAALADLGASLRAAPPPLVLTSARGSSDHAAHYFKYLAEILTGTPCCSVGASVVSLYGSKLKARGALCLTVSQSGMSPDIVALQEAANAAGARTVALVNDANSPVAANAALCLPLMAGSERSVAATKSFIVSAAAAAAIVAHWRQDKALLQAVRTLPESLASAARLDWPELGENVAGAASLYVVGRGPALPIAAETALKFKETCAIHAEAYSLAEVMHGPLELLGEGFPVVAYLPDDAARQTSLGGLAKMKAAGAAVMAVGPGGLAFAPTGHALLDPVSMMLTAYLVIERIAVSRGRNPDAPRLLRKVTETV